MNHFNFIALLVALVIGSSGCASICCKSLDEEKSLVVEGRFKFDMGLQFAIMTNALPGITEATKDVGSTDFDSEALYYFLGRHGVSFDDKDHYIINDGEEFHIFHTKENVEKVIDVLSVAKDVCISAERLMRSVGALDAEPQRQNKSLEQTD